MHGDQLVQPGQPGHPIGDPLGGQHLAVGGHDAHVMVTLGPIDPDQQHRQLLLISTLFAPGRRRAAAT
jgi:hypothetical protein